MQLILKSTLVAAACCLGMAIMSGPSQAQEWHHAYPTPSYDIYQNPDGTYDLLSDLTRDVWGIPCGVECTREAQARWSHYTYRHPHDEYHHAWGQ